jgi:VIT1/CCC1 family predicted Fe2+/Mn2+ transporter
MTVPSRGAGTGGSIIHEHPDVTGGWLRPAVFGAMDGLVSNFALLMGVAGGSAFSMAAGEYTSVASQSEFARAQVDIERVEITANDAGEQAELAEMYVQKGLSAELATEVAAQIHDDLENAVRVHAREEFGVDTDDLASPRLAAASSFLAFAVGALIPLLPFLIGITSLWPTIAVSLAALFGCGAVVTRVTDRPWWLGGTRQLVLGSLAAALTYLVGDLVGASGI